jgi:hypothetical protein
MQQYVRRHGMRSTIPRKLNERTGPFDRAICRRRNKIERLINRYKQCRCIATRYEKRAANYHAMWLMAATLLGLGFANTPQYRFNGHCVQGIVRLVPRYRSAAFFGGLYQQGRGDHALIAAQYRN